MKTITKAEIKSIALTHNCTTHYQGKTREMWVYGVAFKKVLQEINGNYSLNGMFINGAKQ